MKKPTCHIDGLTALAVSQYVPERCADSRAEAIGMLTWEDQENRWLESVGDVSGWMEGYGGNPTGPSLAYPIPFGRPLPALIVRATVGTDVIAWETAVPADDVPGQSTTFAWVCGVGCNPLAGAGTFDVYVNDNKRFLIRSIPEDSWTVSGADGGRMTFDSIITDKIGDKFGYMRLEAPSSWITAGQPVRIRFVGHKNVLQAYFMPFEITDAVGKLKDRLRDGLRQTVYCSELTLTNKPVAHEIFARADWVGRPVQLKITGKLLAEGTLAESDGLSEVQLRIDPELLPTVEPESEKTRCFSDHTVDVLVEGRNAGSCRIARLQETFLARSRVAVQRIRSGAMDVDRQRAGAMVLARHELLHRRLAGVDLFAVGHDVVGTPRQAAASLCRSLEDFEGEEDVYAKRRGRFETAFRSTVDGSGQLYVLHVPSSYDPAKKYGLRIFLGAYSRRDHFRPDESPDCIDATLWPRTNNSWRGLTELTFREALRDITRHYNIDPDRVCIGGASKHGAGAWRLASRYPHLFAGAMPLFGYTDCYLENLGNVPTWSYHDSTDPVVPVDGTRAVVNKLRSKGCPIIHAETAGGGHGATRIDPAWGMGGWFQTLRRNPFPSAVDYTTLTPDVGRSYWVEILEFSDPNQPARSRARLLGSERSNELVLALDNIDVLAIDLPPGLFNREKDLSIAVEGSPLILAGPLPERIYLHRTAESGYGLSRVDPRPAKPFRPYVAGGLNSMYILGEPLMIVKGTQGDDSNLTGAIQRFCDVLSRRAAYGPWWPPALSGMIPVKADTEIAAEDIRRCNLWIVGPVSSNTLLARLTGRLPGVEKSGELSIGGETYSLDGKGYALLHYNPEAPKRLICVLSSPEAEFFDCRGNDLLKHMDEELPFGLGINEVASKRIVRSIMWGKDWKILPDAFECDRLGKAFATAGPARRLKLAAVKELAAADFTVSIERDAVDDDAPLWDVSKARWHDLKAEMGPPRMTFIAEVGGRWLLDVLVLADKSTSPRLFVYPEPNTDKISPDARYRVAIEPDALSAVTKIKSSNLKGISASRLDLYACVRRKGEE